MKPRPNPRPRVRAGIPGPLGPAAVLGAALVALASGGCAVLQTDVAPASGGHSPAPAPRGEALGGRLQEFLDGSAGRASLVLAQSPWGHEVEVTAEPGYFAASGRVCRHLVIAGGHTPRALACRTAEGWRAQRAVTLNAASGGMQP